MFRNYVLLLLHVISISSLIKADVGDIKCNKDDFKLEKSPLKNVTVNQLSVEILVQVTVERTPTDDISKKDYADLCMDSVIVKGKSNNIIVDRLTQTIKVNTTNYKMILYEALLDPLTAYSFDFDYKLKNEDQTASTLTNVEAHSCFGAPGSPEDVSISRVNGDEVEIKWKEPKIKGAPFITEYRVETNAPNGTIQMQNFDILDANKANFSIKASAQLFLNSGKIRISFNNIAKAYRKIYKDVDSCKFTEISSSAFVIDKKYFSDATGITETTKPTTTSPITEPNSATLISVSSTCWALFLIVTILNQF